MVVYNISGVHVWSFTLNGIFCLGSVCLHISAFWCYVYNAQKKWYLHLFCGLQLSTTSTVMNDNAYKIHCTETAPHEKHKCVKAKQEQYTVTGYILYYFVEQG